MKNTRKNNLKEELPALLGYRKDRLGARLTALVNVIRLSEKLNIGGKYWWLSQSDGEKSDLDDPEEIFSKKFIEKWICVSDREPPDIRKRHNFSVEAKRMSVSNVKKRMSEGHKYWTDDGFDAVHMMDESRDAAIKGFRNAFSKIEFSSAVISWLEEVLAKTENHEALTAFHVRRGDIISNDYWSAKSWSRKYTPDEFFLAAAEQVEGEILGFTDTPKALEHLRNSQPGGERIRPVHSMLELEGCSRAQRDLLELLIMARSRKIYAPAESAFSTAASLLSGNLIVPLPRGLAEKCRRKAHDKLLDRVINHPESFYGAGDLAQSLDFARQHAINSNRATQLLNSLVELDESVFRDHPFLYRTGLELAVVAEDDMAVKNFSKKAVASKNIWQKDKVISRVINVSRKIRQASDSSEVVKDFCEAVFGYAGGLSASDVMGNMLANIMKYDKFREAFLVYEDELHILMSRPSSGRSSLQGNTDDGEEKLVPLWAITTDWVDLIKNNRGRQVAMTDPPFFARLNAFGPDMRTLLQDVVAGKDLPSDRVLKLQLGRIASTLSLFGRYKRAIVVLNALTRKDALPIDLKRQADLHFRLGHNDKALMYLGKAVELAPESYALRLSYALGFATCGEFKTAKSHIEIADNIWPDFGVTDLTKKQINKLKKTL